MFIIPHGQTPGDGKEPEPPAAVRRPVGERLSTALDICKKLDNEPRRCSGAWQTILNFSKVLSSVNIRFSFFRGKQYKYGSASYIGSCNALHYAAAEADCPQLVEDLIAAKADVNAFNLDGSTALHFAMIGNCVKNAEVLLKHDANMYASTHRSGSSTFGRSKTPLGVAVSCQSYACMEFLFTNGVSVNAESSGNYTPLGQVIQEVNGTIYKWKEEQHKCVRNLIAMGADVENIYRLRNPGRDTTIRLLCNENGYVWLKNEVKAGMKLRFSQVKKLEHLLRPLLPEFPEHLLDCLLNFVYPSVLPIVWEKTRIRKQLQEREERLTQESKKNFQEYLKTQKRRKMGEN